MPRVITVPIATFASDYISPNLEMTGNRKSFDGQFTSDAWPSPETSETFTLIVEHLVGGTWLAVASAVFRHGARSANGLMPRMSITPGIDGNGLNGKTLRIRLTTTAPLRLGLTVDVT